LLSHGHLRASVDSPGMRGKGDSATGGACRFLASSRGEMCSSSALSSARGVADEMPVRQRTQVCVSRCQGRLSVAPPRLKQQRHRRRGRGRFGACRFCASQLAPDRGSSARSVPVRACALMANLETACADSDASCFGDSAGIAAVDLRSRRASADVASRSPAGSTWGQSRRRRTRATRGDGTMNAIATRPGGRPPWAQGRLATSAESALAPAGKEEWRSGAL
jgi:hypothetical protein